jgi:hypothetical protein
MLDRSTLLAVLERARANNPAAEIEGKFMMLTRNGMQVSGVSRKQYRRLFDYFGSLVSGDQSIDPELSHVEVGGNLRKITYPVTGETVWQQKKRIVDYDLTDSPLRVSVSSELDVAAPASFQPTLQRVRNRYSFLFSEDGYQVDMTEVTETKNGRQLNKREIEIEYVGSDNQLLPAFIDALYSMFSIIYDSQLVYPLAMTSLLTERLIASVGDPSRLLVKTRNLKKRNLVTYGITGELLLDGETLQSLYAVSIKADGVRKCLIVDVDAVWIYYSPDEYNLIAAGNFSADALTILDGELIVTDAGDVMFLAFDCLVYQNIDYRPANYPDRVANILPLLSRLQPVVNGTILEFKPYTIVDQPDNFYSVVNAVLDAERSYQQDGLIFTPIDLEYMTTTADGVPVVTIYKWKPVDRLTIDFTVKVTNGQVQLYNYDPSTGQNVLFRGTESHPFSYDDFAIELLRNGVETGEVIECGWENNRLVPVRYRTDKTGGNLVAVAQENWRDMMEPLTEATIRGRDLTILFSYHNQVKRDLYESIGGQNLRLLDIGSGMGGDILKWKPLIEAGVLSAVIATEPNAGNRSQLQQRLQTSSIANAVTVVDLPGQASDALVDAVESAVDLVTLMLSLSFFWESDEILLGLVDTLDRVLSATGIVIIFTIDGSKVLNLFGEGNATASLTLDLDSGSLTLHPPAIHHRQLDIHLAGSSTVNHQTEYLVNLDQLIALMAERGFEYSNLPRQGWRPLLTTDGYTLDSLYTTGMFSRQSLPEITPSVPDARGEVTACQLPILNTLPDPIIERVSERDIGQSPAQLEAITHQKSPIVKYERRCILLKGPAINDDLAVKLNCSWSKLPVYRLTVIGDGSCFFHALLKAIYLPYQQTVGAAARVNLVQQFRRDLAVTLSERNPYYSDTYTNWQTIASGSFPRLVTHQIKQEMDDEPDKLLENVDYTQAGLERLLNSYNAVGNEIFKYVADILNVNIIVMDLSREDDLRFVNAIVARSNPDRTVVLFGASGHYEPIVIQIGEGNDGNPVGYQTYYDFQHPFITDILRQVPTALDPDGNIDYDPLLHFTDDFLNVFPDAAPYDSLVNIFHLEETAPGVYNNVYCDPYINLFELCRESIEASYRDGHNN